MIRRITENKKDFLPLLLLGDEQVSQIEKYLERGDLFALYDGDLKSACAVTDEGEGILEIQNIATDSRYQKQGYATALIDYVAKYYSGRYNKIILGTGDVPGILAFYRRRGFAVKHRVADYFTTHYDRPIVEDGVLLKDKLYLERKLMADNILKFDIENIILRPEQPADYRETENVTREAFWNCHVPGCDEHYLLHIMRDSAAFVHELDFVAVYDNKIIGNIVYAKSLIKTDDGGECEVLGLGPISVLPEYQNKGVGGHLIEHTKQIARGMGYRAIFLYGDPLYYSRYGFVAAEGFDVRTSDNMYAVALQAFELCENALSGITGRYFENEVYEIDTVAAAQFDKIFPPKEKANGTTSQKRFLELVAGKMERKNVIIETKRLILRPLTIADAETAYHGWTRDAEVAEYVSWLPHHSIEDTIEWLKEIEWSQDNAGNTAPRDNYIWGFVLKETGELFGSGGLIWEEGYQLYQVGYNIMKSHWNNGYTTEAMRAVLRYAAKDLGIKRVAGGHAKENLASAKVIEKLGFVYDRDDVTPHVDGIRHFDSREYYLDL